jgi:AcrR family transcriptional regulator
LKFNLFCVLNGWTDQFNGLVEPIGLFYRIPLTKENRVARPRFENLDAKARSRILEAAAAEFAALGFEGTSLNQLLERLAMSKGSFYYYFDDKEDLFTTVVDHAWATLLPVEKLDLGELDAATFWSTLQSLMREARARIHANPWLVGFTRLMYDPPQTVGVREALAEKFDQARRWQAGLILRGQQVGAVRSDLPAELLQVLLVGADEAGDRWMVENWERFGEDEVEQLLEELFAIFRRMLEPPPGEDRIPHPKGEN